VNIFVGNLAWGVDDMALREAFEAFGAVDSARVIHDRETGRSRGFGFVEMPNQEEAKQLWTAWKEKTSWVVPSVVTRASSATVADSLFFRIIKKAPAEPGLFC